MGIYFVEVNVYICYLETIYMTLSFTSIKSLITAMTVITAMSTQALAQTPTVSTGPASGVGYNTVTFTGTANANGVSYQVVASFEYGLTTSYGSTTFSSPSYINGSSSTALVGNLSNLSPNTTYHYRAKLTTTNGTIYGSDVTFTTQALSAPTITAYSLQYSPGSTTCTFRATVNPNNVETYVSIEWGLTSAYGHTNATTPGTLNGFGDMPTYFDQYGLSQNKTYHWRAVAYNYLGSVATPDQTFSIDVPSGISTPAGNSHIVLYPNPAHNLLTLKVDDNNTVLGIKVYDATGRIMQVPTTKTDDKYDLKTGELSAGVYWIQLWDGKQYYSTSFHKL